MKEYFQSLRCIVDELALINSPTFEDDLVIYALNGIGPEFKEISAGVWARESKISFEELLDKMVDYKSMLKSMKKLKILLYKLLMLLLGIHTMTKIESNPTTISSTIMMAKPVTIVAPYQR